MLAVRCWGLPGAASGAWCLVAAWPQPAQGLASKTTAGDYSVNARQTSDQRFEALMSDVSACWLNMAAFLPFQSAESLTGWTG